MAFSPSSEPYQGPLKKISLKGVGNVAQPSSPILTTQGNHHLADARSYLRDRDATQAPMYETRPATEAACRWLSNRFTKPTLDEITALTKFQPVSFLLQNLTTERVIVDWANPGNPVAIIDIQPVEGWDEARIWLGLTDAATPEGNMEAFNRYLRTLLDQLNGQHRQLLHYVAQHNFAQWRWLEQFGFLPHRRLSSHGDKQVEYLVMSRAPANV
jgi:hypothetical protein